MQPAQKSPYKISAMTMENPEYTERFNQALEDTVAALENERLRYAFIGGIASGNLGRPRSTNDIDLFTSPDDAENVLRALAKNGFRIERTDPSWLYKAFKYEVLVDVIFKSKGEIYLDPEMYRRTITAEFHGKKVRLVAPEDLLIIKAVAHSELTPSHWHDATALLSHAKIDWPYLLERAKRAPRRVLSLLLYAQSNDIWVPNHVIHELYDVIFSEGPAVTHFPQVHASAHHPAEDSANRTATKYPSYAVSHFKQKLAEDPRSNELDISVEHHEGHILLRGEVSTRERKEAVEKMAREHFSDSSVQSQVRVLKVSMPSDAEELTEDVGEEMNGEHP